MLSATEVDEPLSTTATDHRAPRLSEAALWGAVGGLLGAYLAVFVINAILRVPLPWELSYGESIVLQEVRRVASGETLYQAPTSLPLTVTAYTPLYYLLVGNLQRLLGDSSYTIGRIVSLLATAGGAACLVAGVRSATGRWPAGLLAAFVFLTQNLTANLWGPMHRVDTLALGLSLLGLAVAAAGHPRWAVLPLLLALLTKQTYVAAPAALLLSLWPDRRTMLAFAALYGGGVVAAVLVGQWLTGGWFLWHTVVANANPYLVDYIGVMLGQFLAYNGLPLLLASSIFMLPARPAERLWRVYLVLSLLQTLVSVGKIGASSNYWLEWSAAAAAAIAIVAARLAEERPDAGQWFVRGLVGALLIALPGYQAVASEAVLLHTTGETPSLDGQVQLTHTMAQEPGTVMTDEPGVAIAAGKPIEFEPIFTLLAEEGIWDQTPILTAIHEQRFDLIVLTESLTAPHPPFENERITLAVRNAIAADYDEIGQANDHHFYRPKARGG
jgi:hypothetical protein